jgi:hypothetical protein
MGLFWQKPFNFMSEILHTVLDIDNEHAIEYKYGIHLISIQIIYKPYKEFNCEKSIEHRRQFYFQSTNFILITTPDRYLKS